MMTEGQARTLWMAVLSVIDIIFALLDARIDTLVLAAVATLAVMIPWGADETPDEAIESLMGCCGKPLDQLVSGVSRPICSGWRRRDWEGREQLLSCS